MNILIIGASGFVGSSLRKVVTEAGHKAILVLRRPIKNTAPDESCLYWDDLFTGPAPVLEQLEVDAVVHAAGVINGTFSELKSGNVTITRLTVELMQRFPEARLIYISSVSAINKLGEYGIVKRQSERVIIDSGLKKYTIFRPSLLYGQGDDKNVALLEHLIRFLPLIPVPGGNRVDFQPLYIEDLCEAILRVAQTQTPEHSIYTLAGPSQIGLLDMLVTISKSMGKRTIFIPFPLAILKKATFFFNKLLPSLRLPVQQVSQLHKHEPWDFGDAAKELQFSPRSFGSGVLDMLNKAKYAKP